MSAMVELYFFLGLQVLQKEDGIFLSQYKYIGDILKKFGYSDVRSLNTPMDKENPWGKEGTRKDVDLYLYRSMIGYLMYLTASRPDIMFVVCACARHQVTPKECHLHVVKRIFRYLKGHPKLGLWYPKESPFDLTIVATSTTEAEYVVAASCCGQVLWIQNQLLDYGDCFEKKLISVDYIHTDENNTDLLTKSFDAGRFQYLVCKLFPLLGKLSTVSVFLGFGLTFEGTFKYWRVLRILMISLRLIPLGEHNIDFHLIVDFVEASPLRYALRFKPNVYISHIRQFWSTARIKTTEEGTKILATVDGIIRIVTESSLRRNLKLQNEEGISSLPDTELFEKLTLMGYNISPNQKFTFQKVADEPASPLRDVIQGKACPTDSGFEADQDRATIAKTSTLPHDSAPRVTSLIAAEGTQELEINRLKVRVKLLEDREGLVGERSGDDAPIKGRNLDEGEVAAERVSDDTEEMATILTFMDAATILASGVANVPTGSRSIPTASPLAIEVPTGSDVVPIANPVFVIAIVVTPYRRRKGKEIMVESKTLKKKKSMIDGLHRSNETVAKYMQEYQQFAAELPMERRIKLISDLVSLEQESVKKLKTSKEVPEEAKSPDEVPEEKVKEMMQLVPIEEVEDLNQLWALVKESLSNRPPTSDKEIELWVELKRLYEQDDADQLWTHTQNLMHALLEWRLYDTCRVHHVTAKDKEIFMLVEKDYPLRKGLARVMICYKLQVENYSQMANDLILKIYKIANCPSQQVIEFPLAGEVPTASEESCHYQKKREATAKRIALLGKCPMITPRF
nr:hypothetical protein [Tanacetum cinerariifolium]